MCLESISLQKKVYVLWEFAAILCKTHERLNFFLNGNLLEKSLCKKAIFYGNLLEVIVSATSDWTSRPALLLAPEVRVRGLRRAALPGRVQAPPAQN